MRRPRLLPLIGAAALAIPVLEILVIIRVGHWIGAAPTFLLLVAGVVVGSWLIRREGQRSMAAMTVAMRRGMPSADGLANSGWVVVSGILLIIPGFITDVVAALVIIPFTRRLLGKLLGRFGPRKAPWVPPGASSGDQTEPTVVRGDVL
ncbi:MAG: FxsA family protein [Marmoricola sp.]